MEATPKEVIIYETPDGKFPFAEWLDSIQDDKAAAKIVKRIERLKLGNLGDYKSVERGVCELRIDYGSGYRVYFGQLGNTIVIILCGGDKSTQTQDILKAQLYWQNYRR